jgi:hypothetical protein
MHGLGTPEDYQALLDKHKRGDATLKSAVTA